jgi:hypothetical protein
LKIASKGASQSSSLCTRRWKSIAPLCFWNAPSCTQKPRASAVKARAGWAAVAIGSDAAPASLATSASVADEAAGAGGGAAAATAGRLTGIAGAGVSLTTVAGAVGTGSGLACASIVAPGSLPLRRHAPVRMSS